MLNCGHQLLFLFYFFSSLYELSTTFLIHNYQQFKVLIYLLFKLSIDTHEKVQVLQNLSYFLLGLSV